MSRLIQEKLSISEKDGIFLSIVSPVYGAEGIVLRLVAELMSVIEPMGIRYEIILVEDASPDKSWDEIKEVSKKFPMVYGVKLSRNFGQHYAISAGLSLALGKWVVVMDCDLQDRPSEIPNFLRVAADGYDVVLGRRAFREDSFFKKLCSRLFYGVLAWLTGSKQDAAIANFGLYSSKVIAAINSMPESIRYFPTMVRWVGFRASTLDVEHVARPIGQTSYNLKKLLNLSLDICLAYSDKPLRIVLGIGFLVSMLGFIFAICTIIESFRGNIQIIGYASVIVSIWLLSGLVIFIIGVVGLYVGKVFEDVKRRPGFIIAEKIGGHKTGMKK
jgi:glycosyltransferase involved in cell wall biosynthesis